MIDIYSFQVLILSGLISYLSTIYSIPFIIKYAEKYNLKDIPNTRKQHKKPKIHIGGISLVIGFIISICFVVIINKFIPLDGNYIKLNFLILIAGILFFLIGFIDDLIELSPAKRITFQIFISTIIWSQGIGIYSLTIPFMGANSIILNFHPLISLFLTVIWCVGVTNSINWMDGLDGLASGLIFIASSFLIIIYLELNNLNYAFICVILAFSNLAFLKYNAYPSKILMGDGGSNFIGFIISVLSLVYSQSNTIGEGMNYQNINLLMPLLILFIPLLDMTFVIFSRLIDNKSPFYPDRRHIHHRFLRNGVNHQKTVIYICLLSIIPASLTLFIL
tara:strand:- start:603 stop:1604 length:1002 start_codon:yes stop_codon:yes gene_type:complete